MTDIISSEVSSSAKIYCKKITSSTIKENTIIGDDSIIYRSIVNENCEINRHNRIDNSSIGRFTYTGHNTTIKKSNIGSFASISWNVSIGGANHPDDFVTTSPLWRFENMINRNEHPTNNIQLQKRISELPHCTIGSDVLISTNVVILRNINIGNGAVIGAGAVVTSDVEPYTIVAGVPAKPIRKRFDDQIIAALEEIQWWDWPTDVIRQHIDLIYQKKVNMDIIEQLREIKKGLS
ncbi:CatB-related O-acetyltransferase [Vreelandella nigrificans]|uniref:Chloramphenicol acetyltransferase n=1 Tax=Vreelandella nigrificans TaxID=2042704 RepID=A0A2A4HQW2_9GAMM|nr:CatB-related O-acetyltransferase [Halomonas nigrificans]PCF96491.1 hypothetical protein CPA45_05565 [Halomonas nigrificans]